MGDQRNPVEMTEEEIAEANGERLPQPISTAAVPNDSLDDPPPDRRPTAPAGARHTTGP